MNAQGMAYGGPIPKVYNPLTGEYEDPDMGAIADLLGVASTPQQRGFQGEVRAIDNALMPQAASPTLANLAPSSYGQQVDSAPEIGLNTYQSPAGKMTKVIQGLPQQQQSGGDIDSQINALMSQVTAMMKPGYREKHPDAAFSSREYRGGVQDIQSRPEYQNLVRLLQLKKAQSGAIGTPEKEPEAVRTQKWAMGEYEKMQDGPTKNAFGEKYGLAWKPEKTPEMIGLEEDAKEEAKNKARAARALIVGTPEYKNAMEEKEKKSGKREAGESWLRQLTDTASLVDRLVEQDSKGKYSAKSGLNSAAGWFDAQTPTIFKDASDAESALATITNRTTMDALAEAKKRVGQSFGSMQVKEWERFEGLVRDLKLSRNQATLAQNLGDIREWLSENRELMNAALSGDGGGVQANHEAAGVALTSTQTQESLFNARKAIQKNPSARAAVIEKLKANGIDPKGL